MSDPLQAVLDANNVDEDPGDVAGDLVDSTNNAIERLGDVGDSESDQEATIILLTELQENELEDDQEVVVETIISPRETQFSAVGERVLRSDNREDSGFVSLTPFEGDSVTFDITAEVTDSPPSQSYVISSGDEQEVTVAAGTTTEASVVVELDSSM